MSNLLELIKDVKLKGHSVNSKWHQKAVNEGVKSRQGATEYGGEVSEIRICSKNLQTPDFYTDSKNQTLTGDVLAQHQNVTINSLFTFCLQLSCFSKTNPFSLEIIFYLSFPIIFFSHIKSLLLCFTYLFVFFLLFHFKLYYSVQFVTKPRISFLRGNYDKKKFETAIYFIYAHFFPKVCAQCELRVNRVSLLMYESWQPHLKTDTESFLYPVCLWLRVLTALQRRKLPIIPSSRHQIIPPLCLSHLLFSFENFKISCLSYLQYNTLKHSFHYVNFIFLMIKLCE